MPRQNFWSGLVVSAFALLALTWIIPEYAGSNPLAQMPPELVPNIAAWVMLVCGAIVAVGGLVGLVRAGESPVTFAIDWRAVAWAAWPFAYVAVAVWLLTMAKITWLGVPLIALLLVLLGERRWWLVAVCSTVPVAALYVLSVHLMRVGVV